MLVVCFPANFFSQRPHFSREISGKRFPPEGSIFQKNFRKTSYLASGRAARSFSPCVRSAGAAPPSPLIAASLAYRAALVSRASRHVLSPSCARVRARVTSRQPLVVVPDHGARVRRTRLPAPPHVVKVGSTLSINFYRLTR